MDDAALLNDLLQSLDSDDSSDDAGPVGQVNIDSILQEDDDDEPPVAALRPKPPQAAVAPTAFLPMSAALPPPPQPLQHFQHEPSLQSILQDDDTDSEASNPGNAEQLDALQKLIVRALLLFWNALALFCF